MTSWLPHRVGGSAKRTILNDARLLLAAGDCSADACHLIVVVVVIVLLHVATSACWEGSCHGHTDDQKKDLSMSQKTLSKICSH